MMNKAHCDKIVDTLKHDMKNVAVLVIFQKRQKETLITSQPLVQTCSNFVCDIWGPSPMEPYGQFCNSMIFKNDVTL